ncbi:MAG: GTPase HflX [Ignavibacterium sp.]
MIELENNKPEKAILITLKTSELNKEIVTEHINELEELAYTAGAETVIKIIQDKNTIDPTYYIGKGKAEEISQLIERDNLDIAIFDDDLSSVQLRNLERLFNRKVIDRSTLILDIFASHAKTKEAKTQVELAQLQYLLPRLTRAWTHLSKQYGGIGTKGPGEKQIETDRRIIKNRIGHLKEKLEKIEKQRETQTQNRNKFVRVGLVGYTNAGKSTLFNLLTNEEVLVEDKLFATLDSTTRIVNLENDIKFLLSDTVGFIRKLPANLIASFRSTLNEVKESDIILHIIDISHPYFDDQIKVVEQTLKEMNCQNKIIIKVFNKVDLLQDKAKTNYIKNKYKDSIIISASRGINILTLLEKIQNIIIREFGEEEIVFDYSNSNFIDKIYKLASVLSTKYNDDSIQITYRTNKENSEKIKRLIYG